MNANNLPAADEYVLNKGFVASSRINLMHFLWKEQAGFVLHPQIAENVDTEGISIADVGTGTAQWLIDLSRILPPSTRLDGYDISLRQCPVESWLPENVKTFELNFLEPLPQHLQGKYDVVHIRNFILVVPNGDPASVIKNAMRMLKPGGWLQWDEMDNNKMFFPKAVFDDTESAVSKLHYFMASLNKSSGTTFEQQILWIDALDKSLTAAGMINVTTDRSTFTKEHQSVLLDIGLLTWEEVTCTVLDRVAPTEAKKARELLNQAYEEGRRGNCWNTERVIRVAQKPLR